MNGRKRRKQKSEDKDEELTVKRARAKQTWSHVYILQSRWLCWHRDLGIIGRIVKKSVKECQIKECKRKETQRRRKFSLLNERNLRLGLWFKHLAWLIINLTKNWHRKRYQSFTNNLDWLKSSINPRTPQP